MKRAICIFVLLFSLLSLASGKDLGLKTVVIDPGHGGKDPGCVSKDKKTYEKNIALQISLKLASKIRSNFPDVNVVMTRDNDSYLTLNERAETANKADADLFISIHINAVVSTSPHGFSLHLLGQSRDKDRDLFAYNMDVCRKENEVILMEDDYTTKYQGFNPTDPESNIFMQLMQNSYLEQSMALAQTMVKYLKNGYQLKNNGIWQDPFYVLWKTAMPSILVELGFLSNSSDLAYLRTDAAQEAAAEALFKAFDEYKRLYDSSLDLNSSSDTAMISSEVRYGLQIFSGHALIPSFDKCFLGFQPEIIKVGDIYKYIVSVSSSAEGALAGKTKVKSKYPDCFLVRFTDKTVEVIR